MSPGRWTFGLSVWFNVHLFGNPADGVHHSSCVTAVEAISKPLSTPSTGCSRFVTKVESLVAVSMESLTLWSLVASGQAVEEVVAMVHEVRQRGERVLQPPYRDGIIGADCLSST